MLTTRPDYPTKKCDCAAKTYMVNVCRFAVRISEVLQSRPHPKCVQTILVFDFELCDCYLFRYLLCS